MASASSATDRIGGLLASIPGYRGYRDKEERRDADEAALDQLRLFDEALMSGVTDLEGPVAALEQALAANTDLATPSRDGVTATRKILSHLDLRNEVIETGRPAPKEKIQDILS